MAIAADRDLPADVPEKLRQLSVSPVARTCRDACKHSGYVADHSLHSSQGLDKSLGEVVSGVPPVEGHAYQAAGIDRIPVDIERPAAVGQAAGKVLVLVGGRAKMRGLIVGQDDEEYVVEMEGTGDVEMLANDKFVLLAD